MKFIITILLPVFFIFSFSARAQHGEENVSNGKIAGRIIDSASGQAIEYAAVSLIRLADNKVVNGATADAKGVFRLNNVDAGTYNLLIDFIGYHKTEKENIVVGKENPSVVLGDIKLASKQKTLKEVTIAAEKGIIENKIDRTIYNVDKDVTSLTGVASDVLKKVPQVTVDVDGNVELQGNSNIRFLINGKPSVMFGSNIADVLQSIPSSQIQRIEVITSPGAKYDAEGTGGIINIILKESNAQGINGNISISAGTRLENGSFNLNARKGRFGMHAYISGNAQMPSKTVVSMDRVSWDTTSTSRLLQNGGLDFNRNGYWSGIGFDWDASEKDNFSGTVGYNYFGNSNKGGGIRESILQDGSGNTLSDAQDSIITSNKFYEHSVEAGLSYKRKFKKEDQELEISCNTSNGNSRGHYEQTQKHISPESVFNSSFGNNPATENETNIEINYTHPFSEEIVVEAGGKTEFSQAGSTSDVSLLNASSGNYDYSTTQSSKLTYNRNVYAGYLSSTFKFFKWLDLKAGSRYEYTDAEANYSTSGKIIFKPYYTLVPSIVFSHKFKNEQLLKLGYTRRIERPDYEDMNPFINAGDPKNISTGNPNLLPEIGDRIELGYSQPVAKKGNLTATLFFRGNTNDIQSYTRYYPVYKIGDSTYTNVAVRTRENIGHENNYGLNLFASIPFGEKVTLRTNVSGLQRYIYSGISSVADVHGVNGRGSLNLTYELNSTLVIEAFGYFSSRRINAQGTMPGFITYSFAFRKELFHKNGSLAVTATNFLNEYVNQKTNLTGDNFTIETLRQLPYRSFGINFTYKFGKLEFKNDKEAEDPNLGGQPGN